MAVLKLPYFFAHLEENIPGFPLRQLTDSPESSDIVMRPECL